MRLVFTGLVGVVFALGEDALDLFDELEVWVRHGR
jgi:hypothetical protein